MAKVLIVDDSRFIRTVLTDILSSDDSVKVVGTASNGKEALQKIPKLNPDIVTLDIEMPVLDGLSTLKQIMEQTPLPVIMLSALTTEGARTTINALEMGALDYIAKPTNSAQILEVKKALIEKIKNLSHVKVRSSKKKKPIKRIKSLSLSNSDKILTIGASTGGPKALAEVLYALPENIPPTLVVQHMPEPFTKYFAERLDRNTLFDVKEAEEGDKLLSGRCLVAPGGWHMVVTKKKKIHLHKGPPKFNLRPTVDEMMVSTAHLFKDRTVGVILTGMGDDGTLGMRAIKKYSGLNMAQDKETSVVFGMPKAAIDAGVVDVVLPLHKIAGEIVKQCE